MHSAWRTVQFHDAVGQPGQCDVLIRNFFAAFGESLISSISKVALRNRHLDFFLGRLGGWCRSRFLRFLFALEGKFLLWDQLVSFLLNISLQLVCKKTNRLKSVRDVTRRYKVLEQQETVGGVIDKLVTHLRFLDRILGSLTDGLLCFLNFKRWDKHGRVSQILGQFLQQDKYVVKMSGEACFLDRSTVCQLFFDVTFCARKVIQEESRAFVEDTCTFLLIFPSLHLVQPFLFSLLQLFSHLGFSLFQIHIFLS